jgi:dienelactone hydrolase
MKRDPSGYQADARTEMTRLGVNFSTARELIALADAQEPRLRFKAGTPAEWRVWRRRCLAHVRRTLGRCLESVAPTPRILEKKDAGDHWRYRLIFRTTPRMWAPAFLLVPKTAATSGRPVPGVLAIHGHGYGNVDLVGLSPEEKSGGNVHHNYGLAAVRRGWVVLAPELRGFGQRAVDEDQLAALIRRRGDPEAKYFKRDLCNVQNLKANLLGYTHMGMQLHDLRAALGVLRARPEVDAGRIGACGLSTGGMLALFLTALDPRIGVAVISGTLTSYRSYAFQIETTCGSQLPFGILQGGDLADIACLIAPRPVCFESGSEDFGFLPREARREFRRIKACYRMLGVPERSRLDAFKGGHEWHGAVGLPMMAKWFDRRG